MSNWPNEKTILLSQTDQGFQGGGKERGVEKKRTEIAAVTSSWSNPRTGLRVKAAKHVQLVQAGEDDDHKVDDEKDEAEHFVDAPLIDGDGGHEEHDCGEQRDGTVDKALGTYRDRHSRSDDGAAQEPGQAEAEQDVEDVAAD